MRKQRPFGLGPSRRFYNPGSVALRPIVCWQIVTGLTDVARKAERDFAVRQTGRVEIRVDDVAQAVIEYRKSRRRIFPPLRVRKTEVRLLPVSVLDQVSDVPADLAGQKHRDRNLFTSCQWIQEPHQLVQTAQVGGPIVDRDFSAGSPRV